MVEPNQIFLHWQEDNISFNERRFSIDKNVALEE